MGDVVGRLGNMACGSVGHPLDHPLMPGRMAARSAESIGLDIAQSLQVSRRALREAISRLECLGLVEVRHGTGTFVANRNHLGNCVDFVRDALAISPTDLMQCAELRFAVECVAAGKSAERA